MTNEERDLIASFVQRVGGTSAPSAQGVSGPAPGQGAVAPMPALDRDADALIADLFNRYPEARYRITQMAFLQEHALVEAQNRIARLQWEVQQAQQAAQAQAAPPQGGQGSPWGAAAAGAAAGTAGAAPRGIFSSLFGGAAPRPAAPPPQYAAPPPQYPPQYGAPPPAQYPPGYNPGLFQQQGPGFFGSALRTAAGVAGGMLAVDALSSLFSPHQGFGGGFGGGGFGVPGAGFAGPAVENVTVNNNGPAANPWGTDPMDAGGAQKDDGNADQSAWSPAPPDQSGGWQDAPADPGGGGSQDASADSGGGWQDASSDPGDGGWTDSGSDSGGDFTTDT